MKTDTGSSFRIVLYMMICRTVIVILKPYTHKFIVFEGVHMQLERTSLIMLRSGW
jgi:hypothetical protein